MATGLLLKAGILVGGYIIGKIAAKAVSDYATEIQESAGFGNPAGNRSTETRTSNRFWNTENWSTSSEVRNPPPPSATPRPPPPPPPATPQPPLSASQTSPQPRSATQPPPPPPPSASQTSPQPPSATQPRPPSASQTSPRPQPPPSASQTSPQPPSPSSNQTLPGQTTESSQHSSSSCKPVPSTEPYRPPAKPVLYHVTPSDHPTDPQAKTSYISVQDETLPNYEIPEDLNDLIENGIVPGALERPLSLSTYADYLHDLLFAEDHYTEVDSTASVSRYKNLLIFPESMDMSCSEDSPTDSSSSRAQTFQSLHQDLIFSSSSSNELEEEEEEEEVVISKELLVKKEIKWIKHYNSSQQILLVGEGDFSFSASLAVAFGYATNIIATSLNTAEYLSRNYGRALSNIQTLKSRGAKVMHSVDATEMANHFSFQGMSFNRIVFNFPLPGFFPNKSRDSELQKHKKLVRLFMANAKKMITEMGEIHITHKSNGFFREWNLEILASNEGLRLIEEVHFNYTDYPGYRTKYGFGGDKNFNCNPSKTYKFGLRCNKSRV